MIKSQDRVAPENELALKSAKCNTLGQYRVITDLPHFIHNQRGVLFVVH